MKTNDWLVQATAKLKSVGIGTARLDALVLLEDATGRDRSYLLAYPEVALQEDILQRLDEQVERRMEHEPLAYIRGKTEFYGREFMINKDVLEPRPESETMIELLKDLYEIAPRNKVRSRNSGYIVDVGTGSGALAITAKIELPHVDVLATDIDAKCLKVARRNAKNHGVVIKFLQGNLLEPLSALSLSPDALLCNLPYVPDTYTINQAAAMEPRQAIFGGSDGLDLYRQLFDQIDRYKERIQYVLTESLPMQHEQLNEIAKKAAYRLQTKDDFIQVFKATSRLN